MANLVKRKFRISRRQVANVYGSPRCPSVRKNYPPGQHGPTGRKAIVSDYGKQLRAKQQLKKYYGGVSEKSFKRIYKEAVRKKGDTSQNLIGLLESRLDAAIFRANFVPSIFAARQFVNHKHVTVNGKVVNIPSYRLKIGDIVEVKQKSRSIPMVAEAVQNQHRAVPDYFEVDVASFKSTFLRVPSLEDVPYPVVMEPNLVIEFYSR